MKLLHDDNELYNDTLLATSDYLKIEPAIIEKDYFLTLLLKEIVNKNPNIVFKGGTSLSKCYKIINRFSEDIDIGIDADKATEGMKKELKKYIVKAIEKFKFTLNNGEQIFTRRDYNRYQIEYPLTQTLSFVKPYMYIETAVFFKPYPFEIKEADTYIYRFLSENGYEDLINEYDLKPFTAKVQTLDRTFIDKLFALGDYYLRNETLGFSRHLYDLYKIKPKIKFDDDFTKLFYKVKELRAQDRNCPSANDENDLKDLLTKICKSDYFKADYNEVTSKLLFEEVSYETAKANLEGIIENL